MKTKTLLLLLLIATIANEASAFKIILCGGRNHKYDYVIVTDDLVKCTGNGSNHCPVQFEDDQTFVRKSYDNLDMLEDYVRAQVSKGRSSGSSFFNNWPVTWTYNSENGTLEINVDDVQDKNVVE